MKIYIGADHRGFEMKQSLVEWLRTEGYDVEDCGDFEYKPLDNYPEIAKRVISSVIPSVSEGSPRESLLIEKRSSETFGILLCGSGIGVSIVANRYKGIRCALGFSIHQITHGRMNDHINVLSLPSEYIDLEKAKKIVKAFLETKPKMEEKYLRRIEELDKD